MSINYRYFKGFGIEVVKCENSAISYPVHTHISTFVIGLVLKGEVCLGVGQSSFTCGANQIFTVPPDTAHSLSAKAAYTLISICIDKNLVSDKNLLKERLLVLMNGIGEISHLNREKILNKIDLFEALPDKKTKIVALKNYIERHPHKNLDVEKMSKRAALSRYYFIKKFKNEVGLTPHRFQTQNRVRYAKKLLAKVPSAVAALEAGFYDQSHLIREFKKSVGLTPMNYKNAFSAVLPV